MLINFAVALVVAPFTPRPPEHVADLVDRIRIPAGAGPAHEISA